jgi:hypothetical protein
MENACKEYWSQAQRMCTLRPRDYLPLTVSTGTASFVQELNISVVRDLAVGLNLQDHVGLGGLTFLVNQSVGITESEITNLATILKWLKDGGGPLSVLGGAEAIGLINTSSHPEDWPDVELIFAAGSTNSDEGGLRMAHGLSDHVYNRVFLPIKGHPSFTIFPVGKGHFYSVTFEVRWLVEYRTLHSFRRAFLTKQL